MKFSVVIPVYKAPETLAPLHLKISEELSKVTSDYEIIFVNDACPLGSWNQIQRICKLDSRTKGVNLVRNFGQHPAIFAGLKSATGDWIFVLDCDLQDDPKYMLALYEKALEGYDVVLAKRSERKESRCKKLQSWLFYKVLKIVLDVKMDHQIANFGIYSKNTIDASMLMGDRIRFFPYLISWLGFPTASVVVSQDSRYEGVSSYSFTRALKLAFDIAISSSNRPLFFSVIVGAICAGISFTLGLYFIIRYFTLGYVPSGWTSLSVTVLFSTGLILLNLGILGLYLARTYDQTKQRPIFLIEKRINF
ncbi:MAG: glycosyltransferase family 2 protein [Bdellovibrio sp.]|nr:glycosyltransferase family 2 protein [Bdellovibrio sp.]